MILASPKRRQEPSLMLDDLDECVRRSRKGDTEAFNVLVHHYYPQTFHLACRILGDEEAARDATQESFISAWKNIRRFRGAAKFSTWLHSIAVNQCLNASKRRSRDATRSASLEGEGHSSATSTVEYPPTADMVLHETIQTAIARLSEKLRVVITLRYFGDYTVEEISAALNLPQRTVRSRLYLALKQLRLDPGLMEGE